MARWTPPILTDAEKRARRREIEDRLMREAEAAPRDEDGARLDGDDEPIEDEDVD